MITFNVWEYPYVARILPSRVARKPTDIRTFEMTLSRVFRRNTNRIDVVRVLVVFGKLVDSLVTAGQASGAMQAMFEMPHYSVS
jgi:hypothetical protein